MAVTILKSSGRAEEFDIQKLVDSLIRSGAPPEAARDIAHRVEKQISPALPTKAIYRMARKFLRQYNSVSGMRYSLKRALYALGPSGYPFEKYIAKILKVQGYAVELNRVMDGFCVKHEVDVLASKDDRQFMIECKYHTDSGNPTDVKIALYVHSRFVDIKKAYELLQRHDNAVHQGWLVTNTRCTSDAIKYAECVGLRITSWRYPDKESLEKMIESRRLYPVTILPAAGKMSLETLFRNDIILAQDIADMDAPTFLKKSGLDQNTAEGLKKQADEICPCM